MNGYDTVFANANDEELEFEVMFDQEDSLIDTIIGCNESGDPLTGAENCPAATAEERSCDDCNPDYEKDIDADDTKGAPNDAEGTVGYDFETEPENKGKVDDQSNIDSKDVKIEEEVEVEYDITIPKDTEGTVGYDFEVNPEIGSKDDDSFVRSDEVKIDEELEMSTEDESEELDYEGVEKTVPEEPATTEPVDDKCCEDVEFDFTESAKSDGVDNDVEKLEDPEDDLNDAVLDDVESKENKPALDYDISDEDLIDTVLKN